jgi:hypothetical protein
LANALRRSVESTVDWEPRRNVVRLKISPISLVHNGGAGVRKALDHPRAPWVARRVEATAAQRVAMLSEREEVERVQV